TSAGTSSFTVNAQDSSSPPFMASAALTIIINPALTNAALTGNYAFTFNGYKSGALVLMAGSLVANGNGNITNGVLDYNDGTGEAFTSSCGNGSFTCPTPQKIVTAQSSYSITPNGLGTMTLVTDQGNTFNSHVAITSSGNVRLIQDNADPKLRGSGVIKLQTTGDFGVGSLQGNFVVNVFGADSAGSRYAAAGVYTQSNNQGDISTGQLDTDDGGTPAPATFRGTLFSTVDPGTGRGAAANFTFNSDHNDIYVYAYYVVNHNEAILISANPVVTPFDLTLWSSLRQVAPVGGFSNGTLIGTSLLQFNGADSGGTAQVTAGLFTADGMGGASFSYDQNVGGTTQQQSSKGTYSVDSATGRVALSAFSGPFGATPPVFYVRTSNLAVVVGTDPAVSSGTLEPQTGSPFTNATIVGPYTGGTLTPVTTNVTDGVTWLSSDGAGNMNGTEDTSGPGGPGTMPLTYTYQIDSTGRIVFTGNPAAVGYVISPSDISPTKMVLFPTTDVNPALSVLTGSNN